MAKKIKFPLIMKNDVHIRTLEDLKENFDFEKVAEYYINGKLLVWLKNRYYDEEYNKVSALNKNDKNFASNLCSIFGIEYTNEDVEFEKLRDRIEKKQKNAIEYEEKAVEYSNAYSKYSMDSASVYDNYVSENQTKAIHKEEATTKSNFSEEIKPTTMAGKAILNRLKAELTKMNINYNVVTSMIFVSKKFKVKIALDNKPFGEYDYEENKFTKTY